MVLIDFNHNSETRASTRAFLKTLPQAERTCLLAYAQKEIDEWTIAIHERLHANPAKDFQWAAWGNITESEVVRKARMGGAGMEYHTCLYMGKERQVLEASVMEVVNENEMYLFAVKAVSYGLGAVAAIYAFVGVLRFVWEGVAKYL